MTKPSISVFFPCYNDAKTIAELIFKTDKILRSITNNYEIIVVNDGSKDNSLEVLNEVKQKVKSLKLVDHHKNRGYGGALRSGFTTAKKELVFYTDGDGQYNVNELPLLLSCLTPDVDIVNGIKLERQDDGIRIVLGNAYKSLVRNIFNLPIYDVDCDYRLIRRKIMKGIKLKINSGAVCVELVKKLQNNDGRFREVSVHHYPRLHGKSQFFKLKPLMLTSFDLLRLFFTPKFS